MAAVELLFAAVPLTTGDLVFGDDGSDPIADAIVSGEIDAGMPDVVGRVALGFSVGGTIDAGMPDVLGEVRYFTDTQRPLVSRLGVRFQEAVPIETGTSIRQQDGKPLSSTVAVRFADAAPLAVGAAVRFQDGQRARRDIGVRFQDGTPGGATTGIRYQDALRQRVGSKARFQDALRAGAVSSIRFQEGIRVRRAAVARFQDAKPFFVGLTALEGYGKPISVGRTTRYQDAIKPPPGISATTPPQPEDPCYVPDTDLLFDALWSADTNLVFVCERHVPPEPGATIVVPVRRIYTVINSAMLRRVDGNVLIPNTAMSLTIDADSWTWGFSARVPGAVLPDLEPVDGVPVELEATINGIPYRAIVEGISRERVFARSDLTITGRGKAAVLDTPYSAVLTFGNPVNDRTVHQLANDVLSLNGVSLGWDVDAGWEPDDWLVPAGAWSFQGSHMAALNAIAAAAGAYVQPHRTAKALSVLRRYPAKPWEWGDVTPDYELPSDVVQKESVVWTDKAIYNRVFVRGMKSPFIAQATRAGTAGELEAPMVTDQLMTHGIGARQRALPVLADVGRQAAVSLRLPVLPETGIIPPGKFVRYVDGGVTRIGLVRSVSAEVQRAEKKLTIWQTIGVETHVSV